MAKRNAPAKPVEGCMLDNPRCSKKCEKCGFNEKRDDENYSRLQRIGLTRCEDGLYRFVDGKEPVEA